MNRRSFLTAAGSSAALIGLEGPRSLYAQSGTNPTLFANCNTAHAIAAGQGVYAQANGSIWAACANPMYAVLDDWQLNNPQYDQQIKSAALQITPEMVNSASLNQAAILQAIQVYTPQFTAADVQNALAYVDAQTPAQVQSVITNLQQNGLSPYIEGLGSESQRLAILLGDTDPYSDVAQPLFAPVPIPAPDPGQGGGGGGGYAPPPPPASGGSGGGQGGGKTVPGWNCSTDGFYVFFAGVAFAVLTVMTAGTAPVLVGAAWAGIATWGSLATTAWGVGHAVAGCSF